MRLGRTSLSRILLRQSSRSASPSAGLCYIPFASQHLGSLASAPSCSNLLAVWGRRTSTQLSIKSSCKTVSPTAENDELAITNNKTAPTAITGATASTADQQLSLWRELRVLIWDNVVWILLGTGVLLAAAIVQSRIVGKLTAELSVKMMQYDASDSPQRREQILSTLWSLVRYQAISQGLSFMGGIINRTIARRITHGLQLRVYSELLDKDISLFDAYKTGELAKCVEDRVSNLAGVVGSVIKGLPAMLKVPLVLYEMWNTSAELTKANATLIFSVVGSVVSLYFLCLKSVSEQIELHRAAASSCVTESFLGIFFY